MQSLPPKIVSTGAVLLLRTITLNLSPELLSFQHTMAKQQQQRAKHSGTSLKNARQSAAKQAVKKRSKAPSRISKDQVVDATAQINSQFAAMQALYAQVCASILQLSFPADWSISLRRPETLLLPCRKRLYRISRMS